MGKTHLLQAIGHYVINNQKASRVVYLSSEQFTNEFIDAIQHGTLVKFRKKYRYADILMIDDIQFLGGQGTLAGGVLSHLQHPARRPQADRPFE